MTAALKLDLSARVFAVALLATVVALAGASWFIVISPKRDKAATLQTQIQADQTRLAVAARSQQAGGTTTGVKGTTKAVDSALPTTLAMPQIVDQLNALADQAGVTLDTVSPTPASTTEGNGYYAVPLTVVVDGQFFGVEKFLRLVRNQVSLNASGKSGKSKFSASGRLFGITDVQFEATEPAPSVTATFTMRAYYYSAAATSPQPTSTTSTTTTAG